MSLSQFQQFSILGFEWLKLWNGLKLWTQPVDANFGVNFWVSEWYKFLKSCGNGLNTACWHWYQVHSSVSTISNFGFWIWPFGKLWNGLKLWTQPHIFRSNDFQFWVSNGGFWMVNFFTSFSKSCGTVWNFEHSLVSGAQFRFNDFQFWVSNLGSEW